MNVRVGPAMHQSDMDREIQGEIGQHSCYLCSLAETLETSIYKHALVLIISKIMCNKSRKILQLV